jgi:hypothetical protein
MNSLARTLAAEEKNIGVLAVRPGLVDVSKSYGTSLTVDLCMSQLFFR